MQESLLVPAVSETLGSSSLVYLILSKAEIKMNSWKHNATKIMQEFQDYDNESIDVCKCFFDIEQNIWGITESAFQTIQFSHVFRQRINWQEIRGFLISYWIAFSTNTRVLFMYVIRLELYRNNLLKINSKHFAGVQCKYCVCERNSVCDMFLIETSFNGILTANNALTPNSTFNWFSIFGIRHCYCSIYLHLWEHLLQWNLDSE